MGGGDYRRTSIEDDGASPMLRYSPGRGSRNTEKDRLIATLEIERELCWIALPLMKRLSRT